MSVRSLLRTRETAQTALGALAVVLIVGAGYASGSPLAARDTAAVAAGHTLAAATVGFPGMALTAKDVAALPEAKYDSVIAGLIGYTASVAPSDMGVAYTVRSDTPIYGQDRLHPVARLTEFNFLGEKSVVVVVSFFEGWALILTPARQSLPSTTPGVAPAQTAGWVHADVLAISHLAPDRIIVSVGEQSLTIIDGAGVQTAAFAIGVGTPETPTPTGVTGYLQARYLDPDQGQSTYPIDLTSLHSSSADEPYGGADGGLIGIHFFRDSSGAVSHGCLRLPEAAIAAINQLPLGTPITITP